MAEFLSYNSFCSHGSEFIQFEYPANTKNKFATYLCTNSYCIDITLNCVTFINEIIVFYYRLLKQQLLLPKMTKEKIKCAKSVFANCV